MPLDATANFVRGETDSSLTNSDTTVSVNDASIFPDPATEGEYNVVIWDVANNPRPDQDPDVEVLRVTAIDTTNDDLTVSRGQEATTGASHPSGSAVHLSPTAKMFGDIESTFNEFYDDSTQELTADVNADSVSTGRPPFTAQPGEVQNAIDAANSAGGGTVTLDSEATYDPGSEWHVKTGVHLHGQNAVLSPTSDLSNHIFVDSGSKVTSLNIDTTGVSMSDTNSVILLDTERAETSAATYRTGRNSEAVVDVNMLGTPLEGIGVKFVADGTNGGGGFSMGNEFDLDIFGYDRPVYLETTSGGYLQGAHCEWAITNGRVQIDWSSTDGTGGFDQVINAVLQPESETEIGVRNSDNLTTGPLISGQIWDPSQYNTNALVGQYIRAELTNTTLRGYTDNSEGQLSVSYGDREYYRTNLEADITREWRYFSNRIAHSTIDSDGTTTGVFVIRPDGAIQFNGGGGNPAITQEDLSSRTGNYKGELAVNDGTTESFGLFIWDGGSWDEVGGTATI